MSIFDTEFKYLKASCKLVNRKIGVIVVLYIFLTEELTKDSTMFREVEGATSS